MTSFALKLKKSAVGLLTAVTIAGMGAVVVANDALAATSTMVATGNVNLRSGPSTTYPILATILTGSSVTASGVSSGSWLQVTYNGKTGYAYGTYLSAQSPGPTPTPPTATGSATTTGNVNVRSGPGTSYAIVGYAATGTVLKTTGVTSGAWTQVLYSGAARWVASGYLTTGSATTPTTPTVVGQVRTTAVVNLRTAGNIDAPTVGTLPANTVVDITGETTDTYTQILYGGKLLWIYTAYTTPVSGGPSATAAARIQKVLDYAASKLGMAYVWGAEGPTSFDCSGLTRAAYLQVGIDLPHKASYQAVMGTAVSRDNLQPGDLIFWYTPVGHVSIYIGSGQMIHARGTAYGVVKQSVDSYILAGGQYVGARRFITS